MEKFYTILTNAGKSSIINATLLNKKVEFTHLVLGDANGTYYNPSENQERLMHEVWRGQISNVKIDEENPNWIIIETIVPASDGGFMIREAGILDKAGNLLIIGKHPETYKPLSEDGSVKDLIIRMTVEISNTQAVTLKINPAIVLATKLDVMEMGKTKADKIHNHNDLYHTKAEISTLLDNKMSIEPVTSLELTPINGWNVDGSQIIVAKHNKLVICQVSVGLKNAVMYTSPICCALPQGFRPKKIVLEAGVVFQDSIFHSCHFWITQDGNITCSYNEYKPNFKSCGMSTVFTFYTD